MEKLLEGIKFFVIQWNNIIGVHCFACPAHMRRDTFCSFCFLFVSGKVPLGAVAAADEDVEFASQIILQLPVRKARRLPMTLPL